MGKKEKKQKPTKKKANKYDLVHNSLLHDFKIDEGPGPNEKPGEIILVARTKFGLVEKKIIKLGSGRRPKRGQEMKIHCVGRLEAGRKKFWSTRDKYGKPYKFVVGVGKVIKGWDAGCLSMRVGEISELTISGIFGYGMKGFEEWGIPSMAVLLMEIEVLSIGDEINLLDQYEVAKLRAGNETTFIDRTGDNPLGDLLDFNTAPF